MSRAAATTSPPVFPPGSSPGTEMSGEVTRLLQAAAYFPIFNVHNPAIPNDTVPLLPIAKQTLGQALFTAVNVNEQLQRFDVVTEMGPHGLHAFNAIKIGRAHVCTPVTL